MIADHDRSGWFGGSDVKYILATNYSTKTFEKWWRTKLGIENDDFANEAMQAGTNYEHAILEYLGVPEMDKQIFVPELLLRVNYDGTGYDSITEVKTYRLEKGFKMPKHYVQQVNVEMYAWLRHYGVLPEARIVAYGLEDTDYKNFFREIDGERLTEYPIEYDEEWIENTFLPRLRHKAEALKEGRYP